jgi:lysine 6-dehydrogenase
MKRFVILGAGRQGAAVAACLLEHFADTTVDFVDNDAARLERAAGLQRDASRVRLHTLDAAKPDDRLRKLFQGAACVVSCVPYFLNVPLTDAAIEARVPFTDLGGNVGTVRAQLERAEACKAAGVTVLPDCGLAPGVLNILAEYWSRDWTYESVRLYCGGLPQNPRGPWRYALTFSVHGLLNEYLDDCQVARGGKVVTIAGLSELETICDLAVPGNFEAFATSGGASLAPELYAPRGVEYQYKTIRYPGHRDIIQACWSLGFFDTEPREIRTASGAAKVSPRDVNAAVLERRWPSDGLDLVIARVDVRGRSVENPKCGRIDLIDYAVDRFTAMERTTGFPTAITAALLGGLYPEQNTPAGAFVPLQVVPPDLMIRELHRVGIKGLTARELPGGAEPGSPPRS